MPRLDPPPAADIPEIEDATPAPAVRPSPPRLKRQSWSTRGPSPSTSRYPDRPVQGDGGRIVDHPRRRGDAGRRPTGWPAAGRRSGPGSGRRASTGSGWCSRASPGCAARNRGRATGRTCASNSTLRRPRWAGLTIRPIDGSRDKVLVELARSPTPTRPRRRVDRVQHGWPGLDPRGGRAECRAAGAPRSGRTAWAWTVPPGLPHRAMIRLTVRDRAGN